MTGVGAPHQCRPLGGLQQAYLSHFVLTCDIPMTHGITQAVSTSISRDEMHHLMHAFAEIDADHDGCISFEEFAGMMKAQGLNRAEITTAFEAIDQDHTNMIKFSEFIAVSTFISTLSYQYLVY